VSVERLQDPRYKGAAKTVEEYLYESLTKPSAFVVSGFGKSGSNDTESPMPDVTGGGVGLNEAELAAVIAYLQDSGGAEVTVTIPAMRAPGAEVPAADEAASLKTAEEVIAKYACGTCHTVAGRTSEIGPNLSKIGTTRNKDYLRQAILDPDAVIAKGFTGGMMPGIYGVEMKAKELEMLVIYLAGLK
jgi:mono/diheme cytochrome c family protein